MTLLGVRLPNRRSSGAKARQVMGSNNRLTDRGRASRHQLRQRSPALNGSGHCHQATERNAVSCRFVDATAQKANTDDALAEGFGTVVSTN